MTQAFQKIFPIRREYNAWVADESMEDYALRHTPQSARRWSEWQLVNTAMGGLSFLALEAIGAAITLAYGFTNAAWAIAAMGLVIFLTALPISVCAARYGLDMDLLTRGAGFGYLGSTLTSLIYASFTFIFFALEAAIMAQAVQMALGWPLAVCYIVCALMVIPLVLYGITFISRLQAWTQPLWAAMLLAPYLWLAFTHPQFAHELTGLAGRVSGSADFSWLYFGSASTVIFALIVQVGEQVDYLRFMPRRTSANHWRWWTCVLLGGPGWILMGMLRMLGGAFLAYVALQYGSTVAQVSDPTHLYLTAFWAMLGNYGAALWVTLAFVVIAQIKINVTNAYAGSLAWSNVFSRLTRSHPGRVVWLVFNVMIATLIMTLGVFSALEKVLGIYSSIAAAWVGALVADLVINKPLGLSPKGIEFRRAYLHDLNPVGLGSMLIAASVASIAYFGMLGEMASAFAPHIALVLALLVSPLLAWAIGGRWYIARPPQAFEQSVLMCAVCQNRFECADMARCPAYGAPICSLCCSLDSRCQDRCKPAHSRAGAQWRSLYKRLLPQQITRSFNFRLASYAGTLVLLVSPMALALLVVYWQESLTATSTTAGTAMKWAFIKAFSLLLLLGTLYAWWVVLVNDSRRMAREESERQTQMLLQEIEAHTRTDIQLQAAKERAEAANLAKSRYVAGMAHELRTPLTSILGYAQLLLKRDDLPSSAHENIATMLHSSQHMRSLIDELLDLARIEAGRLRLDPTPLRFPEFLEAVDRMVRPQAQAKGLQFHLRTHGRVPQWVRVDAKRLRQILINLLSNAIRFTDSGSIDLQVNCHSDVVRFDIIDTGIGIAPQDQERIFMPFERGSAGRRTSSTGTGLGLTITRMLTLLMGGELTLVSTPQGSTFSVRLYLSEIHTQPHHDGLIRPLRAVARYWGQSKTLLIVDDQPIHRQLLAGSLIPQGFVVREAASGRECLEIIRNAPPDAILLDLSMDDLTGWQTAELVRQQYSPAQLPIIIVSADLFENLPENLHRTACQAFLGKPVLESELLDTLAKLLSLEWVEGVSTQPPLTGLDIAAIGSELAVPITPLPVELHIDLVQLTRLGNAMDMRKMIEAAQAAYPERRPVLQALDILAQRFDFHSILDILQSSEPPEL
ncbi:ATP-binding protein [Comamonas odontotermitis]|uniref:hybrid sensor histidine kinase/response regulator n=1 Tax=Comamonas odontotermitis TaxID=379895 RepID=UPI0036717686